MAKSKAKATIFEVFAEVTGFTKKKSESPEVFKKRLFAGLDGLDDDKFEEMPEAAQKLANEAIKALKDNEVISIPGFDGDDEEEEEEKPKAKAKAKKPVVEDDEEDEEEEVKPKAKAKGKAKVEVEDDEEDEEEEEKPKKKAVKKPVVEDDDDEDEEEEKPKAKSKLKVKAKAKSDDDDEDEKPKKKAKSKTEAKADRKPRSINREGAVYKIKEAVLKNVTATAEEIYETLVEDDIKVTKSTVQGIRSDFLNSMHVLYHHKKLGEVGGFPPKG